MERRKLWSFEARICPVCNGRGSMLGYFYDTDEQESKVPCRSCNGRGYVIVPSFEIKMGD